MDSIFSSTLQAIVSSGMLLVVLAFGFVFMLGGKSGNVTGAVFGMMRQIVRGIFELTWEIGKFAFSLALTHFPRNLPNSRVRSMHPDSERINK